jgi:hypothetical protein
VFTKFLIADENDNRCGRDDNDHGNHAKPLRTETIPTAKTASRLQLKKKKNRQPGRNFFIEVGF